MECLTFASIKIEFMGLGYNSSNAALNKWTWNEDLCSCFNVLKFDIGGHLWHMRKPSPNRRMFPIRTYHMWLYYMWAKILVCLTLSSPIYSRIRIMRLHICNLSFIMQPFTLMCLLALCNCMLGHCYASLDEQSRFKLIVRFVWHHHPS